MERIDVDAHGATIQLNRDELRLVNNAMNEIINGVHIPEVEFKTRLSESPANARQLLAEIGDTYQALPTEQA